MASRVIMVDPWWNEASEQQAFCRVFRIGQKEETYMSRFCVKNSVDDRLMAMQIRKRKEIAEVMEDNGKTVKKYVVPGRRLAWDFANMSIGWVSEISCGSLATWMRMRRASRSSWSTTRIRVVDSGRMWMMRDMRMSFEVGKIVWLILDGESLQDYVWAGVVDVFPKVSMKGLGKAGHTRWMFRRCIRGALLLSSLRPPFHSPLLG